MYDKSQPIGWLFKLSSGGRTRTCDLRVMSPTSYQLLYPAIALQKYNKFLKLQNVFQK